MSYPIVDVEITEPLPSVTMSGSDRGIAVVLHRRGVPIAFWMDPLAPGTALEPADLGDRIAANAGLELLAAAIREELTPPVSPVAPPPLSIAICTKDRPEFLARCLASLAARIPTRWDSGNKLEILVVDNAPSDDRTRTLVEDRPEVRYVVEPKPGLNFARNRALSEARGELLAFLDDDVKVDARWLDGLLLAWTENQDAAVFTGLVLPLELATEAQILFEKRGGFRRGFAKKRYGRSRAGDPLYPCGAGIFGTGANMVFRRDVLLDLGGFDEALDTGADVPGGGDLDMFYRVIRAGHPLVYEPRLLVFHEHRREIAALRRQYRRSWGLGHMAFSVKSVRTDPAGRMRQLRFIAWWFLKGLRQLQKSLIGRHPIPPGMLLGELWGGVLGICGGYGRSRRRIRRIRSRFP